MPWSRRAHFSPPHTHRQLALISSGHNNRTLGRTDRQTDRLVLFPSHSSSCAHEYETVVRRLPIPFLRPNPSLFQYSAAGRRAACEGQCSVHAFAAGEKRLQGPNCQSQFHQIPVAALKQDPTLDLDPTNAGAIKHLFLCLCSSLLVVSLPFGASAPQTRRALVHSVRCT